MVKEQAIVLLNAVGDISLQIDGSRASSDGGNPFRYVLSVLSDADIVFGNLETVLCERGDLAEKAVTLSAPPGHAQWLRKARFTILNVGNNHILDRGLPGLEHTLKVLDDLGISYIGVHRRDGSGGCRVLECKGLRVGFLGYCEGGGDFYQGYELPLINEDRMRRDIDLVRQNVDVLVISLHWGTENTYYPSPYQIRMAHRLVDAGATLILGHHPHVLQAIEMYRGSLIAYSLGNFQFVCGSARPGRFQSDWTGILRVELGAEGVKGWKLIPVQIGHDNFPRLAEAHVAFKIHSLVHQITARVTKGYSSLEWFAEIAPEYLRGNGNSYLLRVRRYGLKHLLQCCSWLVSPFVLRCYLGLLCRAFGLKIR